GELRRQGRIQGKQSRRSRRSRRKIGEVGRCRDQVGGAEKITTRVENRFGSVEDGHHIRTDEGVGERRSGRRNQRKQNGEPHIDVSSALCRRLDIPADGRSPGLPEKKNGLRIKACPPSCGTLQPKNRGKPPAREVTPRCVRTLRRQWPK